MILQKQIIKLWLINLQVSGKRYSTIHNIRGVVRPAFQMAFEDDILEKNPFNFQLASVIVNDSVTREAISRKQERQFLEFVKNDKHFSQYYDGIFILFKTGIRISEFCGLTISDVDMKERIINIDHQLVRTSQMKYKIEKPKSASGKRKLNCKQIILWEVGTVTWQMNCGKMKFFFPHIRTFPTR